MTEARTPSVTTFETSGGTVEILGAMGPRYDEILTQDAVEFLVRLERRFRHQRRFLLMLRKETKERLARGALPDFLGETRVVREHDWVIAPAPSDLTDRRVELAGPVGRKWLIQALNSDAQVCIADFEDATSPTWANVLEGQIHLVDAVRRTIQFTDTANGNRHELSGEPGTLIVRPRGLHLEEAHVLVNGNPISAALFDFGLYFFHNAHTLMARGSAPYFYLPKLEGHLEAQFWNGVFKCAQDELRIAHGTIKASVLIETVLAAFEMDEILYQLRDHAAGLACGRWDYVFSFIKQFRDHPEFVLPDREHISTEEGFLQACSLLLIQTCHRRGAHAIGSLSAELPDGPDVERNAATLDTVRREKERECRAGHDGTWVGHPALVDVALEAFASSLVIPNQLHKLRADASVTRDDLLAVPTGPRTLDSLRHNTRVSLIYLHAWLSGDGSVAIEDRLEDVATAEICRTQIWQWLAHGAELDDGRVVDLPLVGQVLRTELCRIAAEVGVDAFQHGKYELAAELFESLVTTEDLADFLTLVAYPRLAA